MSLENIFDEFNVNESEYEYQLVVSEILIPFSKSDTEDIYTGEESIPFVEKDTEYQVILKQEFLLF